MRLSTFITYLLSFSVSVVLADSPTVVVATITVAATQPTNAPSYVDDQKFQSAVLNSTNCYRDEHNATAVKWNNSLADYAKNYAGNCKFEHSGGPNGENLAEGYANATAAIEAWGDERSKYNFDDGGFSEDTGHFTQLVWKTTTSVGCGRSFCNGKNDLSGWFVVCEYYPPGNYEGQYQADVQSQVKCEPNAVCSAATTIRPTMFSTSLTGTPSSTATSGCSGWCVMSSLGLRGVWLGVGMGMWMTL